MAALREPGRAEYPRRTHAWAHRTGNGLTLVEAHGCWSPAAARNIAFVLAGDGPPTSVTHMRNVPAHGVDLVPAGRSQRRCGDHAAAADVWR